MATETGFTRVPAGAGRAYDVAGELIVIKASSAETGGAFVVIELASRPGGGPPLHTHAAAETFTILEGAFEFNGRRDGAPFAIRATQGDTVFIPGGAPHTYRCVGDVPGRTLLVLAPGADMERFFAEAGRPAEEPSILPNPGGPPDIPRLMAAAARHGIAFV